MVSLPSVFELYAIVLFLALCRCQSTSFGYQNNGRGGGCWKKSSLKPKPHSETREHIVDVLQKRRYRNQSSSALSSSFFTWEASIDGPTGVASSNEQSGPFSLTTKKATKWLIPRGRRGKSSSHQEKDEEGIEKAREEEERLVVEMSRRFVGTWSDFLCRGSISLGILRCAKDNSSILTIADIKKLRWPRKIRRKKQKSNGNDVSSSSLMARFVPFPVKLLEFGKAVESSSSSSLAVESERKDDECDNGGLVVLGSWDIPLKGGTLILQDDEPQQQESGSSSSCSSDYLGKLTFAIAKITPSCVLDQGTGSDYDKSSQNNYQIITGIEDYRPWLAGGGYTSDLSQNNDTENLRGLARAKSRVQNALKANRETTTRQLCHAFYLSTQSMVHAYVTWRFHNAWRRELNDAVRSAAKNELDTNLSDGK